jgi:ABC-2 type transport system ATP-binding protein
MTADTYAIDVEGLTKIYSGRAVVDGVTLRVPRGRIYGFLGPNGSGKTTTIRMLCGLLTPDRGGGTCLGFDLRKDSASIKRRTGYMTQRFSYWEDLTIRENLSFVATVYSLDRVKVRVDEALENLGLTARADQLTGALSGGWKQRLSLAAAVLHDPDLLLLDEPTSGVDPRARREFWDEIHRLAAGGMTVLVSTHYMDEAERCHAIIYMSAGKIVTQGSAHEVVARAGLVTWTVSGEGLIELLQKLQPLRAISSVAPFGDSLHVSGIDEVALLAAVAPFRSDPRYVWTKTIPTMEDVFFHYASATEGKGP